MSEIRLRDKQGYKIEKCDEPFCENGHLIYREGDELYHGISGINGVMVIVCTKCGGLGIKLPFAKSIDEIYGIGLNDVRN